VLWDLASSKEITVLKGHRGPVWSVAYAPEGNLLASAGTDGTIRFWDPVSGRERVAFDWQLGRTRVVAFSPDGMRAAAGGDEGIAVWDVDAV
jgi:WD40 repeat protein